MMTREEIYKDIEETLGGVGGYIEKLYDSQLELMWETTKQTFLSDMSLGLKVNALTALSAAYALDCEYWIEFHSQTARLAGASEENIQDVKKLSEFSAQWSQFLEGINYDFKQWKEEATAAHQFIAGKMGG